MSKITLTLHFPPGDMPDADTDVLIWAEGEQEAQLGALNCSDPVEWVDAQGEVVRDVVAWSDMPALTQPSKLAGRIGRDADLVPLANGRTVDFGGSWELPS